MNRIDTKFAQCKEENRKALVMFLSAGDPNIEFSEKAIESICANGTDILEIGVPFSDPMADGVAIQEASSRALASGTTLPQILDMIKRIRDKGIETPIVLFSYYNVIMQYGVEKLADVSAEIGIDAWLVVDVPYEEQSEVLPILDSKNIYLITLLAPTTPPERIAMLSKQAKGFVYCITVTGVTGVRTELPPDVSNVLDTVKANCDLPIVAGFGISTPEMAEFVSKHADGVVVGSALVRTLHEKGLKAGTELVSSLSAVL